MSIIGFQPITQQTNLNGIIDLIYGLRSAYVEMMDALKETREACHRANNAARRVLLPAVYVSVRTDEDEITVKFWQNFLSSLSVMEIMSPERRKKEVDGWLYPTGRAQRHPAPEPPDFTVENMIKRFEELESRRDFFIHEWALTCFEKFVHKRPQLNEIRVPRKVIVKSALFLGVLSITQEQGIARLDRFFHFMDGADFSRSSLVSAINGSYKNDYRGETDYFSFTAYSNDNLHLTFKRRDLTSMWESLARQGLIERMENAN